MLVILLSFHPDGRPGGGYCNDSNVDYGDGHVKYSPT